MTPKWMTDTVASFGRLLGLTTFALNERGVAGVRFENGSTFRIEAAGERFALRLGLPLEAPTPQQALRILAEAQPLFATPFGRLRAVWLARTAEAALVLLLPAERADASLIDQAFRELWDRAERLRRGLWD